MVREGIGSAGEGSSSPYGGSPRVGVVFWVGGSHQFDQGLASNAICDVANPLTRT